jgi:hypothetical protein
VGAIFVAENASATKHTRHIEARYHFVREFIIDGHIKIIFVMSKENKADIFTKNVTSEIFQHHVGNYLVKRQVVNLTTDELEKTVLLDSGGVLEHETVRTESSNKSNKYKKKETELSFHNTNKYKQMCPKLYKHIYNLSEHKYKYKHLKQSKIENKIKLK